LSLSLYFIRSTAQQPHNKENAVYRKYGKRQSPDDRNPITSDTHDDAAEAAGAEEVEVVAAGAMAGAAVRNANHDDDGDDDGGG
jgi:hypothetical protein